MVLVYGMHESTTLSRRSATVSPFCERRRNPSRRVFSISKSVGKEEDVSTVVLTINLCCRNAREMEGNAQAFRVFDLSAVMLRGAMSGEAHIRRGLNIIGLAAYTLDASSVNLR